jgi:FkbM family methyltransferase
MQNPAANNLVEAAEYDAALDEKGDRVIPKLLVRTRHGFYMVLETDVLVSKSLYVYGEHHENEWQLLKRFIEPGHIILDIGANLGTFTIPFARAVGQSGKVIAFEPQPVINECLRTTVMLNKMPQIEVHRACVGNDTGMLDIVEPDYTRWGNFSGLPFREDGYNEVRFQEKHIQAPCVRIDDLFKEPRLDMMKLDIEGMELEAFEGAEKTIEKFRPVIFFENNRMDKSPPIMRWLMDRNYRSWWHTGPFFNPHNFAGEKENIFGSIHNLNMLCLPRERGATMIAPTMLEATDPDDHLLVDGRHVKCFSGS